METKLVEGIPVDDEPNHEKNGPNEKSESQVKLVEGQEKDLGIDI